VICDLLHRAAQDLARARLGQALDDHGLGGRLRSLEPGGSFELEG
jgi:hypothetical protein